jgi:membrane protein DedA with SNARE-associated domain
VPVIGKHVTRARIERAELLFADWGVWVVAIGRMFAGVRGAVVIAAGATRFNFIKFIIADGLGAVVSGGLFIALGHWAGTKLGDLGELSRKVRRYEHILLAIGIVVAVAIVAYVWWRRRRHETIADAAIKAVEHKIERRTHAHDSTAQAPEHSDPVNRREINTDK